jgi:hypothetical protein
MISTLLHANARLFSKWWTPLLLIALSIPAVMLAQAGHAWATWGVIGLSLVGLVLAVVAFATLRFSR